MVEPSLGTVTRFDQIKIRAQIITQALGLPAGKAKGFFCTHKAIDEILKGADTQLDPTVEEAFQTLVEEMGEENWVHVGTPYGRVLTLTTG